MATARDVVVIVGSLRSDSLNRKLALAAVAASPPGLAFEFVDIGGLPLFNPELDTAEPPAAWTAFRQRIAVADGFLFVTPEHNRSMPAAMKNAIDIGSRPSGRNAWHGKPAAVMSASPGGMGGFGAHHHLRQALVGVGIATMPQPEVYVGNAGTLFDAAGQVTNDKTRALLVKFTAALERWIDTVNPPR
jgi:chromate reductase